MAEEDDSGQEKTEEPSSRKLEKAREEGQVPRSRELTTTAILLIAGIGLYAFAGFMSEKIIGLTRENFSINRESIFDPNAMLDRLAAAVFDGFLGVMPLIALLVLAAILGPIALGGWLYSPQSLLPKLDRMSPLAGLKRMFSMKSLMELAKALAKVLVILGATILVLQFYAQSMFRLGDESINQSIIHSMEISVQALIILASVTILIAAIDVPIQIFEFTKKMRMSRQDLKDESKDTDGKPEVKGRIRQLQREIAQRRMMAKVPEADVIITNPTHYAVALQYKPESMDTPVLLAKGGDHIAFKIREIGAAHKVDIIESPALARAIYHTTDLDTEIPSGLYLAVAQILAYVFQLRNYRKGKGDRPVYPKNISIPKDMQFD